MLTTLLPPTSGRASVGGYDIVRQGPQVRAAIGAALQEAALDAILTGREHLLLQATLQGLPSAERRRRADALLERVGLTEAADRRVGGYSGGMKRRLDLALACRKAKEDHGARIAGRLQSIGTSSGRSVGQGGGAEFVVAARCCLQPRRSAGHLHRRQGRSANKSHLAPRGGCRAGRPGRRERKPLVARATEPGYAGLLY